MEPFIEINNRRIGIGEPVYIVAEMSANHNQNFDQAVKIIEAAKSSGADAIKLQTYTPDTMTIDCDNEHFRIKGTLWEGKTLYDLYGEAYTPWEWQPELKRIANNIGLDLFSSAFDHKAVDFLEEMGVACHKLASFELVDHPLIEKMVANGKPILISTGMANKEEIREALEVVRKYSDVQVALLKCTSAYPAPPEEMNLLTLPEMSKEFGVPVGLSDHSFGITAAVVAVALGACIIEKHFTLSREIEGPDSYFSLEPGEFEEMVRNVRLAEKELGKVKYGVGVQESHSLQFRRSLFVVEDMNTGDIFTEYAVRSIRPGYGIAPKYLRSIFGKRATQPIKRGTPLSLDLIEETSA